MPPSSLFAANFQAVLDHWIISAWLTGRQYFRLISGDGKNYGVSAFPGQQISAEIIIGQNLSQPGDVLRLLYSNQAGPAAPAPVALHAAGTVRVADVDGTVGTGPLHTTRVTLAPMEVRIIDR